MMGNSRRNEKGKVPVCDAYSTSSNTHAPNALSFLEGNEEEDTFDSLLDMAASFPELEDFHRSVAQGIPGTVSNPRGHLMNPNSFQSPQINLSSNTLNTSHQGVPLLPDWKMSWGQQGVNQGHNAMCAGGFSNFGGESSFASFNRPQVNRDTTGSSFLFHPRESELVRTRNSVSSTQSQNVIQGNVEGSFLSLGIGGTEDSVPRSQLGSRETSDKLKESASSELKMGMARKSTVQTLGAGLMGLQSNSSGFSNQFLHENRMTSNNNEVGFHGSLNSWPGSSPQHILYMQQKDMQHSKNRRSGDLDHFRDDKLKEAVSNELKTVHARKATSQTSGQPSNAGFMGFHSNISGFSNQFSNVHQMTSTKNEVGDLSTLNSGLGTSRHHVLHMQQNDSRNIKFGDLDHHRAFMGNQSVHSGTFGGNSAQFFSPQHNNLNKAPEFEKPSWLASYHTSSEQSANSPSYAGKQGQVIPQNATPSQVLGSNIFSQRTAAPQVSWVDRSPAGIDVPFPKRLGVEFNVRNSLQTDQRHLSPMETSLQTRSTGRTSGAPVSCLFNSQEPFFAHGQSQNALIQLAKTSQGAPTTSASTVSSQSQKPDLHIRPHHKRSAVAPHPASHWVQRQKIIHPTIHHSMPKPYIPVTTARIHPVSPVGSHTQPVGPVAARAPPVIPCASNVRPRAPVTHASAVSHITWKDPEATPKLSGYKCFLCKRDLAITSDGPLHQPTVSPPVAVLPCGHSFHDQCLQNITPDDQAKDPPCIPCAIGEQ